MKNPLSCLFSRSVHFATKYFPYTASVTKGFEIVTVELHRGSLLDIYIFFFQVSAYESSQLEWKHDKGRDLQYLHLMRSVISDID